MPILLYKKHITVVSHEEFFNVYKSLLQSSRAEMTSHDVVSGFDALAMSKIFEKRKNNSDPFNTSLYRFEYKDIEAQMLTIELIVFFSEFYNSALKVYDSEDNLQKISNYIVPHKLNYQFEKKSITIKYKKIRYTLLLIEIREVYGIINNFRINTDRNIFHFSCNPYTGKKFQVLPYRKNYMREYRTNDYYYESNTPSRLKFLSRRKRGFLFIMV
jgi:hypothetical protein